MKAITFPPESASPEELVQWYKSIGVSEGLAESLGENWGRSYKPWELGSARNSTFDFTAGFKEHLWEFKALQVLMYVIQGVMKKNFIHIPEPSKGLQGNIDFLRALVPNREFLRLLQNRGEPLDLTALAQMDDEATTQWLAERQLQEYASSMNVLQVAIAAIMEHNKEYS